MVLEIILLSKSVLSKITVTHPCCFINSDGDSARICTLSRTVSCWSRLLKTLISQILRTTAGLQETHLSRVSASRRQFMMFFMAQEINSTWHLMLKSPKILTIKLCNGKQPLDESKQRKKQRRFNRTKLSLNSTQKCSARKQRRRGPGIFWVIVSDCQVW